MAQKRMFSLSVVDTDKFLEMPSSAQALYFHLGMHGDDDGFVASPKKIMRSTGCADADLRILIAKGYIIPFDSGVVVITDWAKNNTLKNDRYRTTVYQAEKSLLSTDKSGSYVFGSNMVPQCIQHDSDMEPQHNVTKQNQAEPNLEGMADKPPARPRFIRPTIEEIRNYCTENNLYRTDPEAFFDYYESNGWKVGKNPMRDWKRALNNWERREAERKNQGPPPKARTSGQELLDMIARGDFDE